MTNLSDKDAAALDVACAKLSQTLKLLREIKGLSLRAHAKLLDVSPATLSRIEAGDAPDLMNLIKILLRTGISYDTLLGDES